MRVLLVVPFIAACSAGPLVLVDPPPVPNAWAGVALTMAGSGASQSRWRDCTRVAQAERLTVSVGAPAKVSLLIDRTGNHVELPDGTTYPVAPDRWTFLTCEVAFAYALGVEKTVRLVRAPDAPPTGCTDLGTLSVSYDGRAAGAAVEVAALRTHERGGNVLLVTTDGVASFDQETVAGRVLRCAR